MLPPWSSAVEDAGVTPCRIVQNSGELVLVLPRAHHCTVGLGLAAAEAIDLAPPNWLEWGRMASASYRLRCGPFANHLPGPIPRLPHEQLVCVAARAPKLDRRVVSALQNELVALMSQVSSEVRAVTDLGLRPQAVGSGAQHSKLQGLPCIHCRHACFLAAVTCDCTPGQVACCSHIEHLCGCKVATKMCIVWQGPLELQRMLNALSKQLLQKKQSTEEQRPRNSSGSSPARKRRRAKVCVCASAIAVVFFEPTSCDGLAVLQRRPQFPPPHQQLPGQPRPTNLSSRLQQPRPPLVSTQHCMMTQGRNGKETDGGGASSPLRYPSASSPLRLQPTASHTIPAGAPSLCWTCCAQVKC